MVGVGVVPQPKSVEIPDIMEIKKAELSDDQDCFYNDPDINQMRIQVRSQVWRVFFFSYQSIVRLLISPLTMAEAGNSWKI